jgi:hypothetical protein
MQTGSPYLPRSNRFYLYPSNSRSECSTVPKSIFPSSYSAAFFTSYCSISSLKGIFIDFFTSHKADWEMYPSLSTRLQLCLHCLDLIKDRPSTRITLSIVCQYLIRIDVFSCSRRTHLNCFRQFIKVANPISLN